MNNKTVKFHAFKLHNYLQKCSFHVRQRITVIFIFNFQKFPKLTSHLQTVFSITSYSKQV